MYIALRRSKCDIFVSGPPSQIRRIPMGSKDKLLVFDTSLRDGEQSPGVTLNADEKVEIAKHLSRLGVDILEAGFPAASSDDFNAVQRIAKEVGPLMNGRTRLKNPMVITGLARADKDEIQRCFKAISSAPLHRIHIFLPTSDMHLQFLNLDRDQAVNRAVESIKYARSLVDDVEFSAEDAIRADRLFLVKIIKAVIHAGANTINIPDTVGYSTPNMYGSLMKYLIEETKMNDDKVIWSCHCHNDLGLATANTLEGVMNGARQIEVTVNGIGERAGNAALEEVVMAIQTHPDHYPVYHTINMDLITLTSTLVSTLTGMVVQPNKAIVGRNAFLHETHWHMEGIQRTSPAAYEIIKAETIGLHASSQVLDKNSGRNALRQRICELGWDTLSDHEFQMVFERFKSLAAQKKSINDSDVMAILADQVSAGSHYNSDEHKYKLLNVQIVSGTVVTPTATVKLLNTQTNEELTDAAIGTAGSISAVFGAIQRIVRCKLRLKSFDIRSVGEGIDALGQVVVKITRADEKIRKSHSNTHIQIRNSSEILQFVPTYVGHGTHVDILIASASAYVCAINRMIDAERKGNPRSPTSRHVNV